MFLLNLAKQASRRRLEEADRFCKPLFPGHEEVQLRQIN